jgi:hypothetical protein
MAQKSVRRWNSKLKKWELVPATTSTPTVVQSQPKPTYNPSRPTEQNKVDASDMGPVKGQVLTEKTNKEHKIITSWLGQFDQVSTKPQRTNREYAGLIQRDAQGNDVTKNMLREAYSRGIIDTASYRKRLNDYNNVIKELNTRPVTVNGEVVKYVDPKDGNEKPLLRASFLNNGVYDYKRPIDEVVQSHITKKQQLGVGVTEPTTENKELGKVMGASARGTYNRNTMPGIMAGVAKGAANQEFDLINWLQARDKQFGPTALTRLGMDLGAQTPEDKERFKKHFEQQDAENEMAMRTWRAATAEGSASILDPRTTPEEIAGSAGRVAGGYSGPADANEAFGYVQSNVIPQVVGNIAAMTYAPAGAAKIGLNPKVAQGAVAALGVGGGALSALTKNPLYSAAMDPMGAMRYTSGPLGQESAENLAIAEEMAPAARPLVDVVGLSVGLARFGAQKLLSGGNAKAVLGETQQAIKAAQSSMFPKPITTPITLQPTLLDRIPDIASRAVQGVKVGGAAANLALMNTAPVLAQEAAHRGFFKFAGADPKDYPAVDPVHAITAASGMLVPFLPENSIGGRLNKYQHDLSAVSQARYDGAAQVRQMRKIASDAVPLLKHLTTSVGLSNDQALAYVSLRHQEESGGRPLQSLDQLNNLRESKEIESGYFPTLNNPTLRRVTSEKMSFPLMLPNAQEKPNQAATGAMRFIDPNLRVLTKSAETHYADLAEIAARKFLSQKTITPEKAAEQTKEQRRPIPYPTMIVDTPEGPKMAVYKPDLSAVYLTDDTTTPVQHRLTSESQDVTSNALPHENYIPGIQRFNREDTSRIGWVHEVGRRKYSYVVRGFDRGGFLVTRSIVGLEGKEPSITYVADKNEIMRTAPESMRKHLVSKLDSISEAFGIPMLDSLGRGINYSDTSFAGTNREEFPHVVHVGKSVTNTAKGTIPARLIHQDKAWNVYQLPTGGVLRVPKGQDINTRPQVMAPIDTREMTYAGTRYEGSPIKQLSEISDPESGRADVNYIDISLGDVEGNTKRVFINAKDKAELLKIYKEFSDKATKATLEGKSIDDLEQKANDKITKRLRKLSRTGVPDDVEVTYLYGGLKATPIREGDVVNFQSAFNPDGTVKRTSRLAQNNVERGVVVGIDHNGVHVKLANQLPGAPDNNGGKTVLAHPEELLPIAQPHLGHATENNPNPNVHTIGSIADLEQPQITKTGVPEKTPEVETAKTQQVEVDSSFDGLAPDTYHLTNATNDLLRTGTVQHVHDNVVLVSQNKDLTPDDAARAVTNVLNSDVVSAEHKESIMSAVFMFEHETADINSVIKINSMIDAVSDWVSGKTQPINLLEDITHTFGSTMFSGGLATKVRTTSLNTIALEALQRWSNTQNFDRHVNNYIKALRNRNMDITPEEQAFILKQAKRMAVIIAPLRSALIGNNITSDSVWARASRLSPSDQMAVARNIQTKNRATSDVVQPRYVDALIKSDAFTPIRTQAPRLDYEAFRDLNLRFVNELKNAVGNTLTTKAVEGAQSGTISMVDLNDAIKAIEANPDAIKRIMENVASHDLPENEFRAYFENVRFPNSNITVKQAAEKIADGSWSLDTKATDIANAAIRRLGTQGKRLAVDDWMSAIDPILQQVPDSERENLMKVSRQRIERAIAKDPDNAAQEVAFEVGTIISKIPKLADDTASQISKSVSDVQQRVQSIPKALEKVANILIAEAEARGEKESVTGTGQIDVVGAIRELQTHIDTLHDLNAAQPTKPAAISQEMFDTINANVREASAWLKNYRQTSVRDVVWKLPLQSDFSVFGKLPDGTQAQLQGVQALGKDGLRAAFRNLFAVGVSPELKAVIDQSVDAYADAWDLQAYSYTTRHVDYEMKTGNVDSANLHLVSLLNAVREQVPEQYHAGIDNLITHIQDGKPLVVPNESGKSFTNVIPEMFAGIENGSEFGSKLSAMLYAHRAATVQSQFYENNARLILTSGKPSDFSPDSNIATSYASLTAQKNKNTATSRAQVNLLLHLNKSGDESRNLLSLGHELFHGVYHTMTYVDKLNYASTVLQMAKDKFPKNMAIDKSLTKVKAAQADYKSKISNYEQEIINAREIGDTAAITKAERDLNDFMYERTVDMHGDVNNFLYTDPVINEMVVSSLFTGAMNTPTIFSSKGVIGSAPTSIFSRVGEFAKMAVGLMQKGSGRYVDSDWVVTKKTDSKSKVTFQHRWELPARSFVTKLSNNEEVITHLPLGTSISIPKTTAALRAFATNVPRLRVDPTGKFYSGIQMSRDVAGGVSKLPGASNVKTANTFTVKENLVSLSSIPEKLNGKHVAEVNGVKWFKLDSEDGVPINRIGGVRIDNAIETGVLVYPAGQDVNKSDYYIFTNKNIPLDVSYVSGASPEFNSNLSAIIYDTWAKTSNVTSAMVGQIDKVSYDQLVSRAAQELGNIEGMPAINVKNMDKGQSAYTDSLDYKAGQASGLFAGHKIEEYDYTLLSQLKDQLDQMNPEERANAEALINVGVDSMRRSLFALNSDNIRWRPLDEHNNVMPTSRFMIGDDGNVSSAMPMFFGTPGKQSLINDDAVIGLTSARNLYDYLRSIDTVKHVFDDADLTASDVSDLVGTALLRSTSLDTFDANLQDAGLPDTVINNIMSAIESGADAISNRDTSPEEAFFQMHQIAKSSAPWMEGTGGTSRQFIGTLETLNDPDVFYPNIANQRALVSAAVLAYSRATNRLVSDVLQGIGNNIYSEEFAGVSGMAHLMALDLQNRASANKIANQFELVTYVYERGKSPIVIMKQRGKATRLSDELRGSDPTLTSGELYYAIDQSKNTVKYATPVRNPKTGNTEFIFGDDVHSGKAGTTAISKNLAKPEAKGEYASDAEKLFGDQVITKTNKKNNTEYTTSVGKTSQKYDGARTNYAYEDIKNRSINAPNGLVGRLESLQVGGQGNGRTPQRPYSATMILRAIQSMEQKNGPREVTLTLTLPHSWGADEYDPRSGFSHKNKFSNFDQVLDAMFDDPTGEKYNAVARHIKVARNDKGEITITDLGLAANEQSRLNRSVGDLPFIASGVKRETPHITPTEVYVVRKLLAKDGIQAKVNEGLQSDQRVETIYDKAVTPEGKNPLNGDPGQWNGSSLFSRGLDPRALADDLAEPLHQDPAAVVQDEMVNEVKVTYDPELAPDQIQYTFDKRGMAQVLGGVNMAKVHGAGSNVVNVVNELNGITRALVLGGDIGVAFNQSWMLANPLVMMEHLLSPNTRSIGPAYAMKAIIAGIRPNMGSDKEGTFRMMGIPVTNFGDNYIHLQIEKILSRTPGLTLDALERYGLNLDYLKWHQEWKEALLNNPDIKREDVPIQYRLGDYYGDSRIAHAVMPHLGAMERANAFYRDMAALIDFQKLWLDTEGAVPAPDNYMGRENYREQLRTQFAEAVNLLSGNQSGHYSEVESLARMQKAVSAAFISSRYARSRMLLNPIVGPMVWGLKSGVNAVTMKMLGKKLANTKLEENLYSGGWNKRVQGYVAKRLAFGYLSSKSMQMISSANLVVPSLIALMNPDLTEDERSEELKIVSDNWGFDNGRMKLSVPWGNTYQINMPGGLGKAERQVSHLTGALFSGDMNQITKLPEWTFKQFVTNQLAPILGDAVMAASGKTYDGQDAFASNEDYSEWRKTVLRKLPKGSLARDLMEATPEELSNFILGTMANVTVRDALKDIGSLRDSQFVRGADPELKLDDVNVDWAALALNFYGGGAEVWREDYDAWLKARTDGVPNYKIRQENSEASEYENMMNIYRRLNFGAATNEIIHGHPER